jgi:hypothetical protein
VPDIAAATLFSTHKKCSAIQVASAHKSVNLSPEKCYSFSGFFVWVER